MHLNIIFLQFQVLVQAKQKEYIQKKSGLIGLWPTLSFIQFVRPSDSTKPPKKFNLDLDLKILENLQNTLTEIRKNNPDFFETDD